MFNKVRDVASQNMFFLVQECIVAAFIATILKTIWPQYPIEAFLVFLGPVALGAYGIKKYGDAQEVKYANGKRALENQVVPNRNDNGLGSNSGIPVR